MQLAALFSGGKDSTFAAYLMEQQGHVVDHLVSILPSDPHSWVFHTPNLDLIPLMAKAMGKKLVTKRSSGDEASDLGALKEALIGLEVDGVITGAIASDYQWDRINGVCEEIGMKVFSPLWRKEQDLLMTELLEAEIKAVFVSVSAEGMEPSWLGRQLDQTSLVELRRLARIHGMNLAGEGGEYETMVLDSPIHRQALRIDGSKVELTRDGGRLTVTKAILGSRS
jgi:diphthine-ammonia ligase